jgi:hypothetical protein
MRAIRVEQNPSAAFSHHQAQSGTGLIGIASLQIAGLIRAVKSACRW